MLNSEALLLLLGVLVVGLPVLVPSIHLAIEGELTLWVVVCVALAATWLSDAFWYFVGRSVSHERLRSQRLLGRHLERAEALAARSSGPALLFLSRFLYGTRIAANVFSGAGRMRCRTVALVNACSAVLWLGALFLLVFAVGSTLTRLIDDSRGPHVIVTVLVLFAVGLRQVLVSVGRRATRAAADSAPEGSWPRSISVVIPAYNEGRYIEQAIRSVRRQSLPAQVIVVENGSTDDTAAIARRLADVVLCHPQPLGYSRARNVGAAQASGELLVFLDADSQMAANALETIRAHVEPGAFGTVRGVPDPPDLRFRLFLAIKYLWQRLGLYRGVLGGLLFCDRELFGRSAGFDESMAIDELRRFTRAAARAGGHYSIVGGTRAITSMRRFEQVGLLRSLFFWIRLRLGLEDGADYVNLRHSTSRDEPVLARPGDPADEPSQGLDPECDVGSAPDRPAWAGAWAGPERRPR